MASHWTCKNAILRDLSLAQGREVPVEIENTVGYNEKPPALNYTEETEEEFYTNCVGGGDFNTGPDLQLIQQMLDIVREVDITEIEDLETNKVAVIEISKENSLSKIPQLINTKSNGIKKPQSPVSGKIELKQKKNRNAAIESLIATYGDINLNEVSQKQTTESITKSDTDDNSKTKYQYLKLTTPKLMFKKKSLTKPSENGDKSGKDVSVKEDSIEPAKFVPSAFAGERYQKYLEMSKLQENIRKDVWSKAEQKMKEIESRKLEDRKLETPLSSSSNQDIRSPELKGMDFVSLPQHRHLLTGECTVCQVLCVHSKEDIIKNTQK